MSRWRAAGVHLALAFLVIGSITVAGTFLWYPVELWGMTKASSLLSLIAGIDIVAGPILTLIVYRAGKPGLKLDLTLIALCQAAFLAYGLYTASTTRPVAIVAVPDRFEMVFANEIKPEDRAAASRPEFARSTWGRPVLVGAVLPEDPVEQSELLMQALAGRDVQNQPRYWVPYEAVAERTAENAGDLDGLRARLEPEEVEKLERKLADLDESRLGWQELGSSRGFGVQLIDRKSGAIVRTLGIDPYPPGS